MNDELNFACDEGGVEPADAWTQKLLALAAWLERAEENGDEEGARLASAALLQLNTDRHLEEDPLAPDCARVEADATRRELAARLHAYARRSVPAPSSAPRRREGRAARGRAHGKATRAAVASAGDGPPAPSDDPDPSSLASLFGPFLQQFVDTITPRVAARVLAQVAAAPVVPGLLEERRAAEHFGAEPRSLRAGRQRGELATYRVGRVVFVDVAEVESWLRGHRVERALVERVEVDAEVNDPGDGGRPRTPLRLVAKGRAS